MSGENVEMLDRIYGELFGNRTLGADLLAEDVEWVNPPDAVERGVRRGIEASTTRSGAFSRPGERFDSKPGGSSTTATTWSHSVRSGASVEGLASRSSARTAKSGPSATAGWFVCAGLTSHAETLEAAGIEE